MSWGKELDAKKKIANLKPGDVLREPMKRKNYFLQAGNLHYLKTGVRIEIRAVSEDEIQISL